MRHAKKAGDFEIEYYTDGAPSWVNIKYNGHPEAEFHGLRFEELHDLKYIIDRTIDTFAGHK